jgi:hypothetical protein
MTKIKDFYGAAKPAPLQALANETFTAACKAQVEAGRFGTAKAVPFQI